MIILIIKLILLLVLCVWASISDLRKGIVSNRLIAVVLAGGFITDITAWCFFDAAHLKTQLINIGSVWLISVLLYVFHIWAGGDCKLMLAVALLIPYECYCPLFNKSVVLIAVPGFAFILGYIFLLVDSIVCAVKHSHVIEKKQFFMKTKEVLFRWVSCVSYIVFIDQLLSYVFYNLVAKYQWLLIVINLCLILIVTGVKGLRNKYVVVSVFAAGIIIKMVLRQPVLNRFMVINYSLAILFIILRVFIDEYNYETIETSCVREGMVLSLATTLLFTQSKVAGLPMHSTEDLRSRITEEQANSIKRWEKSKYGTPTIEIVRKIPFAIFISSSALFFTVLGVLMR